MKRILRNLLVVAAGAVIVPGAQAGIIASWSFDNTWTPGSTTASIANTGTAGPVTSATLNATLGPSADNGNQGITRGLNSGTDYYLGFAAGSANGNNLNNTTFILQLATSASLSSAFTITYDARTSATGGSPNDTWAYSLDGGVNWTDFGSSTVGSSFGTYSVTTTTLSVGTANGIQFRDTITGGTASKGTADFNNVSVNGLSVVPEPTHYALAAFGLIFVGTGAGRWCYGRMKRA